MKKALFFIALAVGAQNIKFNPLTGQLDLVGGGAVTAGSGITVVGSTVSADTAVMESRANAQAGTTVYGRSTTGNDAYVVSLTPALTAYTRGSCLILDADTASVGTATINVDTLGAKSILGKGGVTLANGDIPKDTPTQICYDGTQFTIGSGHFLFNSAAGGSTNVVVRNGASQSGNLQEWQNNAGSTMAYITSGGYVFGTGAFFGGGNGVLSLGYYDAQLALASNYPVAWSNTSGDVSATRDTGLARNAAGIVETNNGTAGTIRDFKTRHLIGGGTAPTISSGFGTSPSIAGTDMAGRVTVGTGGVATSGVVLFGTAWGTAPACTVHNETTQLVAFPTATTTQLTIASSTAFTASDKLVYICVGY